VEIAEVGFLLGQQEPQFVQSQPFTDSEFLQDRVTYKMRHEYEWCRHRLIGARTSPWWRRSPLPWLGRKSRSTSGSADLWETQFQIRVNTDLSSVKTQFQGLQDQVAAGSQQMAGATEPFNRAILNQHQSIHLLAEEMGIRLPRAVVGGISEMLPPINMIGPGADGRVCGGYAGEVWGGSQESC